MNSSPREHRQPASPEGDTAQEVWVDLLAEIIVATVQEEEQHHA